jgi:cell wall-associated NlpC family hydrolase
VLALRVYSRKAAFDVRARRYLAPMALRTKRARLAGLVGGAALIAAFITVVALTRGDDGSSSGGSRISASVSPGSGIRDSEAAQSFPEPASSDPATLAKDPSQAAAAAAVDTGPSPGAPSDAEVRRDLRRLEEWKRRARAGGAIAIGRGGDARAPAGSPTAVQDMVAGGNEIATFPYRLGGGHGSFIDNAYDCSGSVSYALAAAGLLDTPLTSGDLMKWGAPGPGRWMTVYANPGHVFMIVGGIRFDTSGRAGLRGSRWQPLQRPGSGFVARHWPGL